MGDSDGILDRTTYDFHAKHHGHVVEGEELVRDGLYREDSMLSDVSGINGEGATRRRRRSN